MTTDAQENAPDADTISMIEKQLPTVSVVKGETIVSCCAWCYPAATFFEAFPRYSGMSVSHGICPAHRAEMLAGIEEMAA